MDSRHHDTNRCVGLRNASSIVFAGVLCLCASSTWANDLGTRSLPTGTFANPSFESGSFSGWIVNDIGLPTLGVQVSAAGASAGSAFFSSAPSHGTYSAVHGFEGQGPGTITLAQDVTFPADAVYLMFDYRAGWDLDSIAATQDRVLRVVLERTGGGDDYEEYEILRAVASQYKRDTGPKTGRVNVQPYAGQSVRVRFEWEIPENLVGPGFFEFDNVRLEGNALYIAELATGFGVIDTTSGAFSAQGTIGATIDSMAYDTNTDTLYGVMDSPHRLVVIDQQTGAPKDIGLLSIASLEGLAFDPNSNTLYGAREDGVLYHINTLTAAPTEIGSMVFADIGGLAFDRFANELYAVSNASGTTRILSVNPSTGASVSVHTGGSWNVQSLAFYEKDRLLYGIDVAADTLIRFDPVNDTSEVVGTTASVVGSHGMAGKTPMPTTLFAGVDTGNRIGRLNRSGHYGGTLLSNNMDVSGMAYDPVFGRVLMSTFAGDLYEVRQDTITLLNSPGVGVSGALAFDPNTSTLYGTDNGTKLYSVDVASGVATLIGSQASTAVGSLAFDRFTNTLYGVDDLGTPSSALVAIDVGTGAHTTIGYVGFHDMDGLTFCEEDGWLYGTSDLTEELIRISPTTGAGESLGRIADNAGNLVFATKYVGMTSVSELPDYHTEQFDAADFDLDYTRVTFVPDDTALGSYQGYRESASGWSVDPATATALTLGGNDFAAVTLTGGPSVSLYGVEYSTVYVGSNGYLTFGTGDATSTESIADHFALPRISGLFCDLAPSGNVSSRQMGDRLLITFDAVVDVLSGSPNSFQIELFYDGTVRLTWLAIGATDALIGLSSVQAIPFNFEESDISNTKLFPPDFDADGIPDFLETINGMDAGNPTIGDVDVDGLSDWDELFVYFTDAGIADSDGDGLSDGEELELGFDPLSAASTPSAATWVNFGYVGAEAGSYGAPFNTMLEARDAVQMGGIIRIKSDSSAEVVTMHQPVVLEAIGGTVQIGTP